MSNNGNFYNKLYKAAMDLVNFTNNETLEINSSNKNDDEYFNVLCMKRREEIINKLNKTTDTTQLHLNMYMQELGSLNMLELAIASLYKSYGLYSTSNDDSEALKVYKSTIDIIFDSLQRNINLNNQYYQLQKEIITEITITLTENKQLKDL